MANTYTFQNPNVEAYVEYKGFADVVFIVHWRMIGTSSEINPHTNEKYTAFQYGQVTLDTENLDPATFVSKDNLTETIVIDWVKDALGEDEIATIKASIKADIDEQKNPTTETFTV